VVGTCHLWYVIVRTLCSELLFAHIDINASLFLFAHRCGLISHRHPTSVWCSNRATEHLMSSVRHPPHFGIILLFWLQLAAIETDAFWQHFHLFSPTYACPSPGGLITKNRRVSASGLTFVEPTRFFTYLCKGL